MGSCPSKRRKSLDQRHETLKEEETKLGTKVCGMVENTEYGSEGLANSTNGDKSTEVPFYATDEQHTVPKLQQSFSWLASTPVGSGTFTNQQKEKPKITMEVRDKTMKL